MTVNLSDPKINTFITQSVAAFKYEFDRFVGNEPISNILSVYKDFTDITDSTKESNMYHWNGPVPELERLLGDIPLSDLSRHFYLVENEDWGAGIRYQTGKIKDKSITDPKKTAASMAAKAFYWPGTIIQQLLEDGETRLCWDDEFFFSNAHPVESGATFDNLLAVGALAEASLDLAISEMLQFPGDNGRPQGIMPTHLIVPPQLWATAQRLCKNSMSVVVASLTENIYKGMLMPVVDPGLWADPNDWYLARGNQTSAQPFIFQLREKPKIEFDRKDEIQKSLIYLIQKARGVGTYGDPRTALKVVV